MTPKQKAIELFDKYHTITPLDACINDSVEQANKKCLDDIKLAKQCALICVDEIVLNGTQKLSDNYINYWQEVKQEIENL